MPQKNDELLKRLLGIFRIEAQEHLKMLGTGLVELEQQPSPPRQAQIVEKIFREAHSLKGAARAVNLKNIELTCQALESVLSELKSQHIDISRALFDLLYHTIDHLNESVSAENRTGEQPKPVNTQLIQRLKKAAQGLLDANPHPAATKNDRNIQEPRMPDATETTEPPPPPTLSASPPLSNTPETIRVSASQFDTVMRQVEELLSPRLSLEQRNKELREITIEFALWRKQQAKLRPTLRLLDRQIDKTDYASLKNLPELAKLLEYLEAEAMITKTIEDRLLVLLKEAEQDQRVLSGMTDTLLDNVKELYLQPFAALLEVYPRMLRDLAAEQEKQVELVIQGSDIEIDRRILDEMKDPLLHLLRNAIDHGIESPATRQGKHKPECGKITITIAQIDSGKIEMLICDDGCGIDAEKVKATACKLDFISSNEAEKLTRQEALSMIFHSGITTNPIITDVSGRGLGLAIVQEKVEKLGGIVTVDSTPNQGCAFRIVLPLTMATFSALLVDCAERLFVIPAISVECVLRIAKEAIVTVENRATILLDGQAVAVVNLSDVLQLTHSSQSADNRKLAVVVLALGSTRIAFQLDKIFGEQQVAVRTLGPQLTRVRNFAGATVLGNGQIVPVLNVADLMKSAAKCQASPVVSVNTEQPVAPEKKAILVVEDSITSRVLLKNILESVGYRVTTAIDGVDAYLALKSEVFDLVVSDIEMPRMDGFTLTAKIRADDQLADLPIVLVTALESSEHRERGIDVGANAYIVKSSFDQTNLLEVIDRLI